MSSFIRRIVIPTLLTSTGVLSAQPSPLASIAPARMPKVATVDPRFVSYNIEMVEVTGGRFWKPYASFDAALRDIKASTSNSRQVGADPRLYAYRPPIDLANPRLRTLARGIGPAYVRVSGSWANSTYFQDDNKPGLEQAPTGFTGVLTRAEWKGVIEFARSVGSEVMTSFAVTSGTRSADGVWTPAQAKALFDYTKSLGAHIDAVEFMNEPTHRSGVPDDYDAAAFARDVNVFRTFLHEESPSTLFLGPGSVGEGGPPSPIVTMRSEDMLKATGPVFDVFSYHFYGATSRRCTAIGRGRGISMDRALSAEYLDHGNSIEGFYATLRDKYVPGKPIWVTETAEAACGGDEFAGEFVDAFRFVNQLGALARRDVKVVMHNTLAASDYGLLDEKTLEPRPDYWAAVLWNLTMGTTVLEAGLSEGTALRVYAHCMKGTPGGVTTVALNSDSAEHGLRVSSSGERFSLTAANLASTTVLLNGKELEAGVDGSLPKIEGQPFKSGIVRLPARSITFLTMARANNESCR